MLKSIIQNHLRHFFRLTWLFIDGPHITWAMVKGALYDFLPARFSWQMNPSMSNAVATSACRKASSSSRNDDETPPDLKCCLRRTPPFLRSLQFPLSTSGRGRRAFKRVVKVRDLALLHGGAPCSCLFGETRSTSLTRTTWKATDGRKNEHCDVAHSFFFIGHLLYEKKAITARTRRPLR